MKQKPHIILIMTDQHRKDALGCSGNPVLKTENIDSLAAEGYLFRSAYSSAPSCTPARAGLLTGLSPWNHGLLGYGRVARRYSNEMPRMLRDSGYTTIGIGKMHWHPQRNTHGFHRTILDESGRVESPGFRSDYRQWFRKTAAGENPDKTGIGWNSNGYAPYALDEKLHPTRWTGDRAVKEITAHDSGTPLFLKISFARPHSPYDPPARFAAMYDKAPLPPPHCGSWASEFTRKKGGKDPVYGDFGLEHSLNARRHYYGSISFIDEQVGRILEALKSRAMYDNALIVFTSDHGDMLGDHHHWRKTWAYEGSAGIPMIMKTPHFDESRDSTALAPGSIISHPVELRDLLPTFLEAAGETAPAGMDGSSLLSLTGKENCSWRPWIDMEHSLCYRDVSDRHSWNSLCDGKTKYIYYRIGGEEELFDLEADPGELHNLAEDPEYGDQLLLWRERLIHHLSPRGRRWVRRGKLVKGRPTPLHSPRYPRRFGWFH